MGIFNDIKTAIFGHPAVKTAQPTPSPAPPMGAAAPQVTPAQAAPTGAPPAPPPAAAPKEIDPEAALEKIAASKGNPDLDWQHSIVDLMKLIGMDPSLANREELATELGYPGAKDGSAEMNMWLHKAVMDNIRTGK